MFRPAVPCPEPGQVKADPEDRQFDLHSRYTERVWIVSRNMTLLVGIVVLVAVAVIVGLAASGRLPGLGGARQAAEVTTGAAVQQSPYPPPPPTPFPSLEPAGDQGYLAVPSGIQHITSTLSASPYADLLVSLQAQLDAGDAAGLAGRVLQQPCTCETGKELWCNCETGLTTALPLHHFQAFDTEATDTLVNEGIQEFLTGFFGAGVQPLIQGYFTTTSEDVIALDVVIHPLQGTVAIPTPPCSEEEPERCAKPDRMLAETSAVWTFHGPAPWKWTRWVYGDYEELVRFMADYLAPEREENYVAIRP